MKHNGKRGHRQRRPGAGRPPQLDANELNAAQKALQAAFLTLYAEGKHTLEGAALKAAHTSVSTIWRWRAADPEFDARVKQAKLDVAAVQVQQMEDSYFEQVRAGKLGATGFIHWLGNRAAGTWRSVNRVEHTGAGGGPIRTADLTKLTEPQLTQLEKLLALCGLELQQ